MRSLLSLLLTLAVLLPLAAARPDLPDLRGDEVTVGPCVVRWGAMWPGESVGARCADPHGGTLVAASHGTCALGRYTYLNVAGTQVFLPCDWSTLFETSLP